jgi:hypothetical protein
MAEPPSVPGNSQPTPAGGGRDQGTVAQNARRAEDDEIDHPVRRWQPISKRSSRSGRVGEPTLERRKPAARATDILRCRERHQGNLTRKTGTDRRTGVGPGRITGVVRPGSARKRKDQTTSFKRRYRECPGQQASACCRRLARPGTHDQRYWFQDSEHAAVPETKKTIQPEKPEQIASTSYPCRQTDLHQRQPATRNRRSPTVRRLDQEVRETKTREK